MAYGLVFDKNDVKQQLKKYNRAYDGRRFWSSLYGSVGEEMYRDVNQVENTYSNAILNAYISNQNSNRSIANSSLSEGRKQELFDANETILQNAYASNQANRMAQLTALQYEGQQQIESYDQLLNTQAQRISDYAQAHFDYLQYLYDKAYESDEMESSIFMTDPQWSKYISVDHSTGDYSLIDMNTLKNSLFDSTGELNARGIDFFDQMENQMSSEGAVRAESFDQYLQENNPTLFEWRNQYNPYNYTESGTNAGSFREMVGRASTDATYTFVERAGGMSREEAESIVNSYDNTFNELISDMESGASASETIDDIQSQFEELRKLAESLGVTNQIDAKFGGFDNIQVKLNNYKDSIKDGGELTADFFNDIVQELGVTVPSMASAGGLVGTLGGPFAEISVPMGAGIGALMGLGTGLVSGTARGIIHLTDNKNVNRTQAQDAAVYFNALRQEIFNEAFKNAGQN